MIEMPGFFGISDGGQAARWSFLITGLWWAGFAQIPFKFLPKNPYNKKLILENLVNFKATTLEMNWKAQKNEALWKRSYKAYNQLSGLSLPHYFSKDYSAKLKKQDLFYRLPLFMGYPFFRWRFER
jgi:hypothetical protein